MMVCMQVDIVSEKQPAQTGVRRADIQGLRGLSALLIMVYHVWLGRISGGVDVFFAISGFFIGGGILADVSEKTPIHLVGTWSRIISRTVPSALAVIVLTFLATAFLTPPAVFKSGISHVIASALQVENIQLIHSGAEYLGRQTIPSAYQQFWALSVQFQLYAILTGFVLAAYGFGQRRHALIKAIAGIAFFASLAYSLIATSLYPAAAYFHPFARLWEFMAGFLLAAIPGWRRSWRYPELSALIGIGLILSTGLVIENQQLFPGYAALLPVAGAILLIISGETRRTYVRKLLENRYLVAIGNMSFSIYLIHWPIFIFMVHAQGSAALSLAAGSGIVFSSIILAHCLKTCVETPAYSISRKRPLIVPAGLALLVGATVLGSLILDRRFDLHISALVEDRLQPASTDLPQIETGHRPLDAPVSHLIVGWRDFTAAGDANSNCVARQDDPAIIYCLRGDPDAKKSIALIGSSHIYQWEPAFDVIGKAHGIRIYIIGKGGCAIGAPDYYAEIIGPQDYRTCLEWNSAMAGFIAGLRPDLLVTHGTLSNRHGQFDTVEAVPDSLVDQITELASLGIPIIGLRDNPWFLENPDDCLWRNSADISACDRRRDELLAVENPAIQAFAQVGNVYPVDLNKTLCSAETCVAKRAGVFLWVDTNHLTRSFTQHIAPQVFQELMEVDPFRALIGAP